MGARTLYVFQPVREVERFEMVRRIGSLSQHQHRFDAVERGAGVFPEIQGHKFCNVAPESIHARIAHPVLHHVDHVPPEAGL